MSGQILNPNSCRFMRPGSELNQLFGPWQEGPWQDGPWQAGPWHAGAWHGGAWQPVGAGEIFFSTSFISSILYLLFR
jgi:hypothetical protein